MPPPLQHLGQLDAVALPARELADLLLLVAALEAEAGHVGAPVQLAPADDHPVGAPGDLVEDGGVRRQRVPRLVDVGQLDRGADGEAARVGLLLADDHAEQGGLAGAVGADDAHDAAGREEERQVVDEQPVAVALDHARRVDHLVAQAGPGRDGDLHLVGPPLGGLGLGHAGRCRR